MMQSSASWRFVCIAKRVTGHCPAGVRTVTRLLFISHLFCKKSDVNPPDLCYTVKNESL